MNYRQRKKYLKKCFKKHGYWVGMARTNLKWAVFATRTLQSKAVAEKIMDQLVNMSIGLRLLWNIKTEHENIK